MKIVRAITVTRVTVKKHLFFEVSFNSGIKAFNAVNNIFSY